MTAGLYLATNLASLPLSVKTTMRSRFKSKAAEQADAATPSAIETPFGVRALISSKTRL